MEIGKKKFRLAPGTQVREEDFGLLFYTMNGPRLFFLNSRGLLDEGFFSGLTTLADGLQGGSFSEKEHLGLFQSLDRLREKGVILEY